MNALASIFQLWDIYISIIANSLTALGICGLILFWFYQRRVKIQIIVPNIPNSNYKLLFVREGGDGSKLVNKTMAFKDVAVVDDTEKIISINVHCNPRLGFQFKCFVELLGTDKQNRANYKILKKKLNALGFEDISPLAYDGKVWYLLPQEYLFGHIKISPLESIVNNIWYPTLAQKIYPYHSIKLKVPLICEGENVFEENEYTVETTTNNQKETVFFKLLKIDVKENYALIKASIQLTEILSEVKYKFHIETKKENTEKIVELLNNATDRKTEQLDMKLKNEISDFLDFRKNKDAFINMKKHKEELDLALKLRKSLKNLDSGFTNSLDAEEFNLFKNELNTIIEVNSKKITNSEYMNHIFDLIENYKRDYDIKNMKIENDNIISFLVDNNVQLNGDNYQYHWKAKMLKRKLL